jgi:hypothetical protein
MKQKLNELKAIDFTSLSISLAVIKEYKRDRVSHYTINYVKIDEPLAMRLKHIFMGMINKSNEVEEYTYDCPEPEEDLVRSMEYESTDFHKIMEQLKELNPEEDIIEEEKELLLSKSYLIVARNMEGIVAVGFKTLPENWKLKKKKGLIQVMFKGDHFENLEESNVFSISNFLDFIYYDKLLLILSKKNFEKGLNFREGMLAKADLLYEEFEDLGVLQNLEILKTKTGNNQRYLKKLATIKNLGYYKDPVFLQKLEQVNHLKAWGLEMENGVIEITEDTLEDILILLQNKRLHSELTEEDFDVDNAKLLNYIPA